MSYRQTGERLNVYAFPNRTIVPTTCLPADSDDVSSFIGCIAYVGDVQNPALIFLISLLSYGCTYIGAKKCHRTSLSSPCTLRVCM